MDNETESARDAYAREYHERRIAALDAAQHLQATALAVLAGATILGNPTPPPGTADFLQARTIYAQAVEDLEVMQ